MISAVKLKLKKSRPNGGKKEKTSHSKALNMSLEDVSNFSFPALPFVVRSLPFVCSFVVAAWIGAENYVLKFAHEVFSSLHIGVQ